MARHAIAVTVEAMSILLRLLLVGVLTGAGAIALLTHPSPSRSATDTGDPYRTSFVVDTNPDPRVVETTITAEAATVNIASNVKAHALTYNGTVPGPTFHVEVGDTVIVHFRNHLDEVTGIHWHGIELANTMDGTPLTQNQVKPGGTFLYTFTVTRPGIYWYHPHHHGSNNQVFKGMYGMIIVRDPHEGPLQIQRKLPPPTHNLPIVLSDMTVCKAPGSNDAQTYPSNLPHVSDAPLPAQPPPTPKDLCETSPVDANGAPRAPFAAGDVPNIQQSSQTGRSNEGQTVLTNGVNVGFRSGSPNSPGGVFPSAKTLPTVADEQIRLQLLNAATTRYMRLRLTDPQGRICPLLRIGGQGEILDRARFEGGHEPGTGFDTEYEQGEIVLPPGGRADVVVWMRCTGFNSTPATPGLYTLWTEDYKRSAVGFANLPSVPVMHFQVAPNPAGVHFDHGLFVDDRLRPDTDRVEVLPTTNTKPLDPSTLAPAKAGLASPDIKLTEGVNGFSVDDVRGEHDASGDVADAPHLASARYVKPGQVLELTTTNRTGSRHPFHLHGFSIQPLDLTKPGADTFKWTYAEFVDTVDIPAGYTLRFRVRIDPRPPAGEVSPATGGELGRWVMHCHIFFHAESGMLSELVVVDPLFGHERPDVALQAHEFDATRTHGILIRGTYGDRDGDPVSFRTPKDALTGEPVGEITNRTGTARGTFEWRYIVPANDHDRLIKISVIDDHFDSSQILIQMHAKDPLPIPTPTATPTPRPSPTPTATATPTPRPTPAPTPTPRDATAPVVGALKAQRAGRRVALRFDLSERAAVTVTVKRRGHRVAQRSAVGAAGQNTVELRRRLRPGRYRATVRATDLAGNAARPVSVRFRIKAR